MKVTQKFKTTSGDVWTKQVPTDDDNATSPNYYKAGEPGSKKQQSFAAASRHVEERWIKDGKSEGDRPTEIPVPDESADEGFRMVETNQRTASRIGMHVNNPEPLVDEQKIETRDGETMWFSVDELKGGFQRAQRRRSPVRYLA